MRDYSKVSPQFWTGKTGRELRGDMQTQIVALYLMTSPHANMIGIFNCPPIYISHDTGSPLQGAIEGLKKLCEGGFCTYDEDSETVWVHEMARFQIGDELKAADNRVKDIQKQYENLPEGRIKQGFNEKYKTSFHLPEHKPLVSPLQAPPKPEAGTGTVTGTGAELLPPRSENFPAENPIAPAKADAPKLQVVPADETEIQVASRETWAAYAEAYADRYGTKPVRNAKINGQVKQLVQRLGRSEAPPVAAFYVRHGNAFYVRNGHDIGSLLAGCEKLRTEWATGRMVTVTSSQQADRTQSNANAAREAIEMLRQEGYA